MSNTTAQDVVNFWLSAGFEKWFQKDDAFDAEIKRRFGDAVEAAARGEFSHWCATPRGVLAVVILLDQFPRNLHRNSGEAFKYDPLARAAALAAIDAGHDMALPEGERSWFYMPLMHSEDIADQDLCVELVRERLPANAATLKFAQLHRDLIHRFGRFPHRNPLLGRTPTEAEEIYLSSDGAFSG